MSDRSDNPTDPSTSGDTPLDPHSPRAVHSRLWGGLTVIPPFRVEFAKSVEDIQALMASCREGSADVGGKGDGTSVPMAVRSVPVLGQGQGNTFIGQGLVTEENVGAALNLTEYPGWDGKPYRYNRGRKSVTCLSSASAFEVQSGLIIDHDRQLPCVPVAADLRSAALRIGGLISCGCIGNWSVKQGPLAAHVLSLQVVTGAGEYHDLQLSGDATDEQRALAHAVLGGYGGFAVIVSAELATEPAATPIPLPRGPAISAERFMADANQRAEESMEAGYLTGLCFPATKSIRLLRRPLYVWLQAKYRIGETSMAEVASPVTVPPLDPMAEEHRAHIAAIFQEVRGTPARLDAEAMNDVALADFFNFGHWLSSLINKAIARLGVELGRYATEKEGEQGQPWPPRADFNVWLNFFFTGPARATQFVKAVFDDGIGTGEEQRLLTEQPEPLTWAPVFITPVLRSMFDRVPMMTLPPPAPEGDPDHGSKWVYFVGIYPGENDRDKADQLRDYLTNKIFPAAIALGATVYQVGSVPVSGAQHYGDRWPEVQQLKQTYDPANILANGYQLFDIDA